MSKKSEEALNALIQPIRDWLKGNNKRIGISRIIR